MWTLEAKPVGHRLRSVFAFLGLRSASASPTGRQTARGCQAGSSCQSRSDYSCCRPRIFDESLLRGKEFLLESEPGSVPVLRDPDLGILESDSGIVNAVTGFFKGASAGKVEVEALVPRWAAYLQNWVQRFQKDAADLKAIRVGKALVQEGTTMVPVHIALTEKGFFGWIVLVRTGEKLLVSDVQIVESATRTTPFDPESPQEISSPSLR